MIVHKSVPNPKYCDVYLRWEEWIATNPPIVRDLMREYPPKTVIIDGDKTFYVIGISEGATREECSLIVSRIDPSKNFEASVKSKEYICVKCLP
jgi:hypothetical protein